MMFAKIRNGFIILPPTNARLLNGGIMLNCNLNPAWLKQNGFEEKSDEELAQAVIDLVHPPLRYSQLKIIKALGCQWEACRKELENTGLLDLFFEEDSIADNDKRFSSFLMKIKSILESQLDSCIVK